MAERGGQLGNHNAVRAKKWREAIMRALARKSGSVDAGLDAAADKLACLAIDDGDKWALEEIGDRVDGKPAQAIVGDDDAPPVRFQKVERVLVRADATDQDR
jgi:hypothetical protein